MKSWGLTAVLACCAAALGVVVAPLLRVALGPIGSPWAHVAAGALYDLALLGPALAVAWLAPGRSKTQRLAILASPLILEAVLVGLLGQLPAAWTSPSLATSRLVLLGLLAALLRIRGQLT